MVTEKSNNSHQVLNLAEESGRSNLEVDQVQRVLTAIKARKLKLAIKKQN